MISMDSTFQTSQYIIRFTKIKSPIFVYQKSQREIIQSLCQFYFIASQKGMGNFISSICGDDDTLFINYFTEWRIWEKHLPENNVSDLKAIFSLILRSTVKRCCNKNMLISSTIDPLDGNKTGSGLYYKPQKLVYYGKIKQGLPSGQGIILFIDKNYYVGNFSKGYFEGQGKTYNHLEQELLDGTWERGILKKGKYYGFSRQSGVKQIKFYQEGIYQIKYEDNSVYFGQGKILNYSFYRHGQGKFRNEKSTYFYQGKWQQNLKYGEGKQRIKGQLQQQFQGHFKNDQKWGKGILKFSNGFWLEAEWRGNNFFQGEYFHNGNPQVREKINQDGNQQIL